MIRALGAMLEGRVQVISERGAFVLGQLRNAGYEYYQATPGDEGNRASYRAFFRRFALGPLFDRHLVYGHGLRGFSTAVPRRAVRQALERLESELAAASSLSSSYEAFGRFYTAHLDFEAVAQTGRADWISKEPTYGRHADDLQRMVPGCRLVVLARDGRDVALSMARKGWGGGDVLRCMERWRAFTEMTLDALERVPAENKLLLRYEWLLSDFDDQFREIARFYRFDVSDADLARARERNPPVPGNCEKWKSELGPEQLDWFDRHCGASMERLGYTSG